MANLTKDTNWTATATQTTKSATYTFPTGGKYTDRNISLTVSNRDAVGSVTMTAGNGSLSGSNCTLSDSNTSGISVTGKGSVSASANITTSGYAPQKNGFATGASTASNPKTQYITGVTLGNSKTFTITDPINTWTWTTDASGNVTIT